MDNLVFIKNSKAICNSLEVAEHFKKRHDHVIRDIEEKILYAEKQGSKHMNYLYMVYSKLANKAAGVQNREFATIMQINNLATIENIILHVIQEGIKEEKGYKEIYQNCKMRLDRFQEVAFLQVI